MNAHASPKPNEVIPESRDPARVGGKGAALQELIDKGFNVPAFFVIPHLDFTENGLSGHRQAQIASSVEALGDGPFAVRSSAVDEDSADHSHAGQFLSILNVESADVGSAAKKVHASGAADSVKAYQQQRGLSSVASGPSVVVQKMVDARCAGVMFTADPLSGRRDRIVISAVEGLGEQLVSGEVDGETTILTRDGTPIEKPENAICLSEKDRQQLHALALDVETSFGHPQDIEWAFEGDALFLLQSRPITTDLRPALIQDEKLTIFDNSNIVESYPGLVSPLTYSFAQHAYSRVYVTFLKLLGVGSETIAANAVVFDNMLARVDGRVYYNLLNWYRLLAMLPGYQLNRSYMETMMGLGEALPEEIARQLPATPTTTLGKIQEGARVAQMGALLLWAAYRLPTTIKRFEERFNAALKTDRKHLSTLPLSALAAEYRGIEAKLLDRWDAPIINDFLCMITFGASRKMAEKWAGEEGLALHNSMMIGQGDIISAEPPRRINEMAAIARTQDGAIEALDVGTLEALLPFPELHSKVNGYIDKFGDRCSEELKLESITLDKDPTPIMGAIAASARSTPNQQKTTLEIAPSEEIARLFESRPIKRFAITRMLRWAKEHVKNRENLRFERTRIFGHARKVFLAIGEQFYAHGVLDDPRDIFNLTVQEVLGAIEGNAVSNNLSGLAALRNAERDRYAALPNPGERVEVNGAAFARDPGQSSTAHSVDGSERTATGCSAGVIRARAKVVFDPRNETLEPGQILVASNTDPGWIALFANAGGIVVERGSLLSHSAIVAREMGIPCVVGMKGATDWIVSGDLIEVDGRAGRVTIIESGDSEEA